MVDVNQLRLSCVCIFLPWEFVDGTIMNSCGHTIQTFYLGKHDLLTVYLGKLDFLSVTDFSLANLPRGNFIVWGLDMSRKQ